MNQSLNMGKFDISELQNKVEKIWKAIYAIKDNKENSLLETIQFNIDKANIQIDNLNQLKTELDSNLATLHNSLNLTSQELSSLIEIKIPSIANELHNIKREGLLLENNLDNLINIHEIQVQAPFNLLENDIQKLINFIGINI